MNESNLYKYKGKPSTPIGALISKYLTEAGMTQEQLAKELDVTPPYISMITRSGYHPSVEFLNRFADYFGLSHREKCNLFVVAYEDKEHLYIKREITPTSWELISLLMATDIELTAENKATVEEFINFLHNEATK